VSDEVRIKYISWRNGRPRFQPGTTMRAIGYRGQDLRHDDGRWFTVEEASAYSENLGAQARPQLEDPRTPMRPAPSLKPSPKASTRNLSGFVYFLRSDTRIKIGFSRNPSKRLATLKPACRMA